MTKYLLENGKKTNKRDGERLVWYGLCGYWTDNWDKVEKRQALPICPKCGVVGYQNTMHRWLENAAAYELKDPVNKGYLYFIKEIKEKCFKGTTFEEIFRQWQHSRKIGSS